MSKILFLNKVFLEAQSARIDPSDRGLLLGDGCFETIRCHHGQPLALSAHWKRLSRAADVLKIPLPLSCEELRLHISQLLSANQLDQCVAGIRLTITRGTGKRGLPPPQKSTPTTLITCFSISENSKTPVSLMLSDILINEHSPLVTFKALGYAENIIARQKALSQGYDDALLCNTKGQMVSASSANVFFVIDKELHTPALSCGVLPGITRHQILQIAKQLNIPSYERVITPEELQYMEEAFLTNSIHLILPIGQINQRALQTSTPAITPQLQNYFESEKKPWACTQGFCVESHLL